MTTENNVMISISDALGNVVFKTRSVSGKTEVDMERFSNGIYFMRMEGENGSETKQIVITI